MSYDLMVFNKDSAARNRAEFLKWYDEQTQWTEKHGYDDPSNTTIELSNWFKEMILTFPEMNGPNAEKNIEDPHLTDYSIGKNVIYAAFAWSLANDAYEKVLELAAIHDVGFFDLSVDSPQIYFSLNGNLVNIDTQNLESKNNNDDLDIKTKKQKSKWKFW